jgi:hypothetical protein
MNEKFKQDIENYGIKVSFVIPLDKIGLIAYFYPHAGV